MPPAGLTLTKSLLESTLCGQGDLKIKKKKKKRKEQKKNHHVFVHGTLLSLLFASAGQVPSVRDRLNRNNYQASLLHGRQLAEVIHEIGRR